MHQNIPPNNPRCRLGAGCASDRRVDRLFSCFITWKEIVRFGEDSILDDVPPQASPSSLGDQDDAAQPGFPAQTQQFRFGPNHRVSANQFHEGTAENCKHDGG